MTQPSLFANLADVLPDDLASIVLGYAKRCASIRHNNRDLPRRTCACGNLLKKLHLQTQQLATDAIMARLR